MPKTLAVVLLSGGLDSAVALAVARHEGSVLLAVTAHYGQRAFEKEWQAAQALARWAGVPHRRVDLPWLASLLPTGMQPDGLPHTRLQQAADAVGSVWVPNRNGVLLNVAAAYAEHLGADCVVFGANADEGQGFADNTSAYRQAATEAMAFSTRNKVRVWAPLEGLTKQAIWQKGLTLNVPLQHTWSCYEADALPCGICMSCQYRLLAESAVKPVQETHSP